MKRKRKSLKKQLKSLKSENGFSISMKTKLSPSNSNISSEIDSIKNCSYESFIDECPEDISDGSSNSVVFSLPTKEIQYNASENSVYLQETSIEISNESEEDTSYIYENFIINNALVVILKHSQKIKLYGVSDCKVLYGKIELFGSIFGRKSAKFPIYSPKGSSLLTIQNKSNYCEDVHQVNKISIELKNIDDEVVTRKDSCVLLFTKKIEHRLAFIEKYISHKITPEMGKNPSIIIEPAGKHNVIEINNRWNKILENVNNNTKLFLCGGKGVGKSTFLRYAVNFLLPRYKEIRVIDLDPGQSELTLPGSLDICIVRNPLMGPSYTHLMQAEKSILCNINVSYDPQKYLNNVQELVKNLPEVEIPTIINFIGYTSDVGYNILACALLIVRPNTLLELKSPDRNKNYSLPIRKSDIREQSLLLRKDLPFDFDIDLLEIELSKRETEGWALQGREMREMCIMSYFGSMMTEYIDNISDYRLPIYELSMNCIKITDINNNTVHVDAANANIVALCFLSNEKDILFEVIGWGIVRAIDKNKDLIYLLTPENDQKLEKTTHFVVGALVLPASFYLINDGVEGPVPYVGIGKIMDYAQTPKRSHLPPKKVRGQVK